MDKTMIAGEPKPHRNGCVQSGAELLSRRAVLFGASATGVLSAVGMSLADESPVVETASPGTPVSAIATRPMLPRRESYAFDIMAFGLVLGRHVLRFEGDDSAFVVHHQIEAEVKPLGIPIYAFDHDSSEHFEAGRLTKFESQTLDGGSSFFVEGDAVEDRFEIRNRKGVFEAPADVMPGSFWTPVCLTREVLIEPKRGRLKQTIVHNTERLMMPASDGERPFTRYTISGILKGYVDYDDDQEWIGCTFETQGTEVSYRPRNGDKS
jgi:hypothetical protein